jgi:hypothetical protein
MATENDWLTHNLRDRLRNKNVNFEVYFNVPKYRKLTFDEATKEVAEKLYAINNKLFVGLSGGIDSEYVFRRFVELKIPFIPVIVYGLCYKYESDFAFEICKKFNIEPVVINVDESDIIKKYKFDIYDKLNSFGLGGVPALLIAEYAKEHNGIYVKGEHMVGDIVKQVCTEMNEWDFYNDVLIDGYTYDFFLYTPEIVYSMVSLMDKKDSQTFKCDLYVIPYREKVTVKLSVTGTRYYHWLKSKMFKPTCTWLMEPKQFLERYF